MKGGVIMPNIKPISDLRNYPAVLEDVAVGSLVYLTKNGRGCYAIIDIAEAEEYERTKAEEYLGGDVLGVGAVFCVCESKPVDGFMIFVVDLLHFALLHRRSSPRFGLVSEALLLCKRIRGRKYHTKRKKLAEARIPSSFLLAKKFPHLIQSGAEDFLP